MGLVRVAQDLAIDTEEVLLAETTFAHIKITLRNGQELKYNCGTEQNARAVLKRITKRRRRYFCF